MHATGTTLPDLGSRRLLTSRSYPPTAHAGICMSFHYHMYGSNVGQLSVLGIYSDGSDREVNVFDVFEGFAFTVY